MRSQIVDYILRRKRYSDKQEDTFAFGEYSDKQEDTFAFGETFSVDCDNFRQVVLKAICVVSLITLCLLHLVNHTLQQLLV